ncbi:MAG: hypothetical protein GY830_01620 [Bacteroidetes bacterium]|nr:hypothetical protein [Bacteroidota bacterium]
MDLRKKTLDYHKRFPAGKISILPSKPLETQEDLSLAYTPGVAIPCLEIQKNEQLSYDYTNRGNLVAIISNGTAVLGLGNIGAAASKPVMEGKAVLFKKFSGVDSIDLEVNETNPKEIIKIVKSLAPSFGGINLEDIKAPECFEIEKELIKELDIPVMHDDQHGTAIIVAAGLINALELVNKKFKNIKLVVSGAGAGAIACTNLLIDLGVKKENLVMLDSKGVINTNRDFSGIPHKKYFATNRNNISTLSDSLKDTDVFLGLSSANIMEKEEIQSMNENPIVFALANPDPEISYEKAIASRKDVIVATGRSDHPNQINNVLGFPYIFRGALDVRSKVINKEMKLAAANSIAKLAKKEVPESVKKAYNLENISFGKGYLIPKPLDHRLLTEVTVSVAKAAIDSNVARKEIKNWDEYKNNLVNHFVK